MNPFIMKNIIRGLLRNDNGHIRFPVLCFIVILLGTSLFSLQGTNVTETWNSQEIGSVAILGNDSYDEVTDSFVIRGRGIGIKDNADSPHFLYQSLSGDGEIIARI